MSEIAARSLVEKMSSSPVNYWAAMVVDACAAAAFAYLGVRWFSGSLAVAAAAVVTGLIAWSLLEYALHRWLLHGVLPAPRREHVRHHGNPQAMISTPVPTMALLLTLLWALSALAVPRGTAALLIFGLYAGYNYFGVVHHLQHHYEGMLARSPFFARTLQLHVLHHRRPDTHFGITSSFWDRVFGTFLEDDQVVTKHPRP